MPTNEWVIFVQASPEDCVIFVQASPEDCVIFVQASPEDFIEIELTNTTRQTT